MLSQNSMLSNSHHQTILPSWAQKYNEQIGNKESVSENEFLLQDRLQKIRSVLNTYGKDNFSISFSGGKDSCVLSALVSEALGDYDNIPRVYVDTGIDLSAVRDFVYQMAKEDSRIQIIPPSVNIRQTLETYGYPFKSKPHSHILERYQREGMLPSVKNYLGIEGNYGPMRRCPKCLKYQFTDDFHIKISDLCCVEMKEKPLDKWSAENHRPYTMIGIMREEGGRRTRASCLSFRDGKLHAFQPLSVVTKEWEDWYIKERGIQLPEIYGLGWTRSGCRGCPFALNLKEELRLLERYYPNERRAAELLWAPIYAEYRRIGFRLSA